jgi:hypothetical protein
MSRKDPRRALPIRLSAPVLRHVRQRQARSRGRRLMDTVRVMLTAALNGDGLPPPPRCPAPPDAPVRLLQLPRPQRTRLADLSRRTGLDPSQLVCALLAPPDAAAALPSNHSDPGS